MIGPFSPVADLMLCLNILVVFTQLSPGCGRGQSVFQTSDRTLRHRVAGWRRAWPNTKGGERREEQREQAGLEQPTESWLIFGS